MPQSIYQGQPTGYTHDITETDPPDGWIYIGETVQEHTSSWNKIPVWNRVGNNWVQLNAALDAVDYSLEDLKFDRVTIRIHDHKNFDYLDYSLTITPAPSGWANPGTLPDDIEFQVITGLSKQTTYTFNLKANLRQGGQTGDSIQTVTTPDNPTPLAPSLTYSDLKNTSIRLNWTDPAGSSATTWNVYVGYGTGPTTLSKTVSNPTHYFSSIKQDTKYRFEVAGVNAEGLEGPKSNPLRIQTGHDAAYRKGSIANAALNVHEFGSWRPDIGWNDWHYWPTRVQQDSIFQGFWTNDYRRYRGAITYRSAEFRNWLDRTYGSGVATHLVVSRAQIERFYRMRRPGNLYSQYLLWHLTNTNVFDSSGAPPVYSSHRNNRNDADAVAAHDSIKAGTYILGLRIPRVYAKRIIMNRWGGTVVNGLLLYRGDGENNGYGTAGYMECAGHLQRDRHYSDSWRYSNLTLRVWGSWNFKYLAYKAPSQW